MNKKLTKKIEKKLDQLQELLDNIEEARFLNSDDSETWDSDILYNLAENLKSALKLLEDQKTNRRNEFGETIILLEPGLCSLMDECQKDEEEDYD